MTDGEEPPVSAVSLKLPPFWPSDPHIWFAQVEAQFATRGITVQKTKFEYVIASLSPEFAMEIRDIILKPPEEEPYDKLKQSLIQRTVASEQRRLQQLFHTEELGDRKPSQLLRRMQQLLGDKATSTDSAFLRELFLQRLPSNVRMVLASTGEPTDIEALASLADKIMEVATPQVSAVTVDPQLSSEVSQLRAEVARLRKLIQSPRSNSRGRSASPARPRPQSDLCWYHQRFGDTARKCKSPCTKAGNHQASH